MIVDSSEGEGALSLCEPWCRAKPCDSDFIVVMADCFLQDADKPKT